MNSRSSCLLAEAEGISPISVGPESSEYDPPGIKEHLFLQVSEFSSQGVFCNSLPEEHGVNRRPRTDVHVREPFMPDCCFVLITF